MDLSALGSTLPPGLADAEREMGDKFRASALSITNLYKSSLSYTKQAYQVGYAACLADVLSTVQSSIGAGQDATQTLSRLMDWAEARETAMAAFAAEDADESAVTPNQTPAHAQYPLPRRAAQTRYQIHLQSATSSARPASAPLPEHAPSSDHSPGPSRLRPRYRSSTDEDRDHVDPDRTFVQGSTPLTLDTSSLQPTPAHLATSVSTPGSSPTAGPGGLARATSSGRISRSPLRYRHDLPNSMPSVPFVPTLPVNLPHLHPSASHSAPPISTGAKRPIAAVHGDIDIAMSDEGTVAAILPQTPSSRIGRGVKRRNMDRGREGREESGDKEKDKEGREDRRKGKKGKDVGV